MATINDVAKLAGVSIKTVSRVLNGEPHVREPLRDRVLVAVRELDYTPSQSARRLAGNRSFLIAYLYRAFHDAPNPNYITIVQSAAALRCRERGYHLVIEPIDFPEEDLSDVVNRLVAGLRPDGVIVTPPLSDWPHLMKAVEHAGTPLVRIAAATAGYGAVIPVDEKPVSEELVAHLIKRGHKRIGMIKPHPNHLAAQGRYEGYVAALAAAGIRYDPLLVMQGYFDFDSGRAAATALLSQERRPTAIFAANDTMAFGAMEAARSMKLRLPDDLAVAGFDDTPESAISRPALTTIRQPTAAMGEMAAEFLISGGHTAFEPVSYELVIRDSTSLTIRPQRPD